MQTGADLLDASAIVHLVASSVSELPPSNVTVVDQNGNLLSDTSKGANGKNLDPGRYCSGLSLKNTVNLAPGVYVIDGGTLKINANTNLNGTGVTSPTQPLESPGLMTGTGMMIRLRRPAACAY